MSLIYNDMFGEHSKIDTAIMRLKNFEQAAIENDPEGYYVCDSGGKDSSVIKQLCIDAGVKFAVYHHHTTVDHPETVYFVRREQKRFREMGYKYEIEYPRDKNGKRITMWGLIESRGFPTILKRFCCEALKEGVGRGRVKVLGVRWAESAKRKNRGIYETINDNIKDRKILMSDNDDARQLLETCFKTKTIAVNPIIDWSDDDVWEYIKLRNIPYNPLYDKGYKRVGCVGCPMNTRQQQELDENPKYKQAYKRAYAKFLETHPSTGKELRSVNEWYNWWISGKAAVAPGNITMFDESEDEDDS